MVEHYCSHDTDIALLQESDRRHEDTFGRIEEKIDKIEEKIDTLTDILLKNGITTAIALLKQSDKRKWLWLGAISASLLGLAVRVILR